VFIWRVGVGPDELAQMMPKNHPNRTERKSADSLSQGVLMYEASCTIASPIPES